MAELLLASASPRRRELLEQIGVKFTCQAQNIDESVLQGESPHDYVERLACEKAQAGFTDNLAVLGSDTCVVLDGEILSKPANKQDAADMLTKLSGCSHHVLTGIALCVQTEADVKITSQVVSTDVRFITLTPQQIEQYIATGEPMDKAGSYGIQGKAAIFVAGIVGSYSNVVGLPLTETAQLLKQYNIPVWCD